jgi:putative Mg2+ transporter-C (MgtC) family protein
MKFLSTFQTADFLDTLVSLAAAFVLATLIGAERQYRQRTAGLRTNVLVAVAPPPLSIWPCTLPVPTAGCG